MKQAIVIPQVLFALAIGLFYYLFSVLICDHDGVLTLLLQPVAGALYTTLAVGFLLVVGLPIRLLPVLNRWWRQSWWLPFVIGAAAFMMMTVGWAYLPLDGVVPSRIAVTFLAGWLLTIFAVLHFFPPVPLACCRKKS